LHSKKRTKDAEVNLFDKNISFGRKSLISLRVSASGQGSSTKGIEAALEEAQNKGFIKSY
jgi:hypothetical protein